MDRKKLVLLLVALVIAVGTAMVARSMFAGAAAPQAQLAIMTCRRFNRSDSRPIGYCITAPPSTTALIKKEVSRTDNPMLAE